MPNASTPPNPPVPSRRLKTGKASTAQEIKSFVRKNLLASPEFPRLYADVVISSAPNSPEAKILARNYKKICERVNQQIHKENSQMSGCKSCTHIKVTGVRCGSPALRGEQFCYFHQRMLRTVRYPASRVHHAALLEDEESIQVALMEIVNALLQGTIELKRAELILRALNTAVRNVRRVKFSSHTSQMVTEIPDYPTPPLEQVDEQLAAEIARHAQRGASHSREDLLAEYFGGADKVPANLREPSHATASPANGAAPPPPPAPAASAPSAVTPKPAAQAAEAPTRKPPASAKEASVKEAPKERKIAAHRASGG